MPESHEEMMKGATYISGIRGITTAYIASAIEVPGRGLEPLRISPPDPKSDASANFATLAISCNRECYIQKRIRHEIVN